MPKGSPELTQARREEIINACEKLYEVMSFKEVTIKEISKYTSFTRPSIYNYFSTREDIFLALLQREYEAWIRYLEAVKPTSDEKTASGFAGMLAESLSTRPILLKLLAMNQFDMEEHSDVRCLAEFKSVCMAARKAVCSCLARYVPHMGIAEAEAFAYAFFPFMFGIYPYTTGTKKQAEALELANVAAMQMSVYELVYNCAARLLK